ncbi:MAG: 2,3-bisphosphoglycerate-independent phosphoglycerate mutase [bacterium]|nr:2,3-bisphosphoglycerate-independent phosphoglycerate mutase [bacterium]
MNKLALIILDGWGIGENTDNNAIFKANTPFFDSIWGKYPHTILQASGEYVGLPEGQIGGSEVGHITIGAGRVLYQELPRINRSLRFKDSQEGIMFNANFLTMLDQAKHNALHLIGLISTGGVHSHEEHLLLLLRILKEEGALNPYIHFISDGRDTGPNSGIESARRLQESLEELQFGKIVTLSGRFYAMDRDNNLNRTERAVRLIVDGTKSDENSIEPSENPLEAAFHESYRNDVTDEFIEPVILDKSYSGVQQGEPIFFWNFRSDRMKQLITAIQPRTLLSPILTMTQYDKSYTFPVLFEKQRVADTLGELLSKKGLTQLRAAETEKYAHVTYFFNGGVEVVFDGEVRSLAESNKVKHDEMPQMKAREIREQVQDAISEKHPDFILVNFANPDMVGHTGNFAAVVEGVETVDAQLKNLTEYLLSEDYICCITADHGNADIMYDLTTGEPHTAHTLNPVPFIVYSRDSQVLSNLKLDQTEANGLSMIAGTVLDLMKIPDLNHEFESLINSQ